MVNYKVLSHALTCAMRGLPQRHIPAGSGFTVVDSTTSEGQLHNAQTQQCQLHPDSKLHLPLDTQDP